MLKLRLISYTANPERVVASAAKLCYSPVGVDEISENLTEETTEKFISNLVKMGHQSPIEHASFTFAAEGVSRTLTHQLVRHRLASYSQQSQRYVKLEQFEYIIPSQIEENEEARKIFIKHMQDSQEAYDRLVDSLYAKNYEHFLIEYKDQKKARTSAEKKSIEDARYVFPNACETKIVFTMNARTLHNFFNLRTCERAQWEIRELAYKMLEEVKKVAPALFRNAGPSCIRGKCQEGKMTCGHPEIPRERIEKMER